MERNKAAQRYGYIDALKCLAIIFVVIGHIDGMKIGVGAYDTLRGHIEYTFQMPLFFFMSGMFASHGIDRGEKLISLLWKKAKTLAWPSILFFILSAIFEHRALNPLINGFGYYWFTFTLFECFCIYYILTFLLRLNKKNVNIVLAIISIAFICLLALKLDRGIPIIEMNNLTKYFHYFFLCTLFAMYPTVGDKIFRNHRIYAFCIIGFVIMMYLIYNKLLPSFLHSLCRDIIVRYMGLFVVFSLFYNMQDIWNRDNCRMRLVRYVGQHSLEIYLLHFFFLPTLLWLKPLKEDALIVEFPIVFSLALILIGITLCLNFILTRSEYVSRLLYGE